MLENGLVGTTTLQNAHSDIVCIQYRIRMYMRYAGEITCTESHLQVTQLFMRNRFWCKWKENIISCGARSCDGFPFAASHRRPLA